MPDVVRVTRIAGYRVHLEFDDGEAGELDLGDVITFRGVFAALRDVSEFAKVRVEPDADVCPDVLYAKVTEKSVAGARAEEDGS